MTKHRKDHPPNLCLVNPAGTHKIILIPKNASTWFKHNLAPQGWQSRDYRHCSGRCLVVLRDPVDRWFSGVVQFCARKFPQVQHHTITEEFVQVIFSQIELDEHTQSQFVFFRDADLDNTDFVWMEQNFVDGVKAWSGVTFAQPDPVYTTAQDHWRQLLRDKLIKIYHSRDDLQQRLQLYFQPEYEMIEQYGLKK